MVKTKTLKTFHIARFFAIEIISNFIKFFIVLSCVKTFVIYFEQYIFIYYGRARGLSKELNCLSVIGRFISYR